MELKLARTEIDKAPKSITLEKICETIETNGQQIYYFDRENSHKNLVKLVEFFEEKGLSVYHRIVKFGLDDNEYMYEVHIL